MDNIRKLYDKSSELEIKNPNVDAKSFIRSSNY